MRAKIVLDIYKELGPLPYFHQPLLTAWVEDIKNRTAQWRNHHMYHFSSLRGQAISLQDGIQYTVKRVKFVIASPNADFITYFTQEVFKQDTWQIGNLCLAPNHAYEQVVPPKLGNMVKYLCLSPVVPSLITLQDENAGKILIDPKADYFSDLLYECTLNNMEKSGVYSADELENFFEFQIEPDTAYLEKLKKQHKVFSRNYFIGYQGRRYEVRGYVLPFTLYAHPTVQHYIYNYGLGAFAQQGLGMVELRATVKLTQKH